MSSRHNKLYLPDSDNLESLRALCRYETHGGYAWYGVTSDFELVCVPCLRAHYRQVFRATRDGDSNGWCLVGYTNSGEIEDMESCVHCGREIGAIGQ